MDIEILTELAVLKEIESSISTLPEAMRGKIAECASKLKSVLGEYDTDVAQFAVTLVECQTRIVLLNN